MSEQAFDIGKNDHPWVTFRVFGQNYCISSEYVIQMIIKSDLTPVPQAPNYYFGLASVRGENFPIIDLRTLFGVTPLKESIENFITMKEKHLAWVSALENSIVNNVPFTLPRDPNKCSFGIWYNSFKTDNISINYILSKIDKPHREMHMQADVVDECRANNNEECMHQSFKKAYDLCHNIIVPLLDQLIEAYINITKGMIILLKREDTKLGILADNITSIEDFDGGKTTDSALKMGSCKYIKNVITAANEKVYLELNIDSVFGIVKTL